MHQIHKQLSENYYVTKSEKSGKFYEVNPKNLTCTCRSFLNRGKNWLPCSHLRDIADIHYHRKIDRIY